MDSRTLEVLEFDRLKALIEPHLRTPGGRRALAALAPVSDADEIARRRSLTAEALRHHLEGERLGPGALDDPDPILDRLAIAGLPLEAVEIARLVSIVRAADALRESMAGARERYPLLWREAAAIPDLRGVTRPIEGRIAADGRLEDTASPDLARIRRRLAELESSVQRAMQEILEASAARGLLQDAYVTVRGSRFVIPVRSEARSLVPGVVHGRSSTGATLFVEPMETLESNNELVSLRDEESIEVARILAAWTDLLRRALAEIRESCARLAALDLLGAIAVFGVAHQCVTAAEPGPGARIRAGMSLLEARHPMLDAGLRARGESTVPLSVDLEAETGALILSGPNAGGKTVALKTIGLLALMNQAGLPVPAREAILPCFATVWADIGDYQSIAASLSTFSARVVRVGEISKGLRTPALVLLDEVGAGTDPEEAGALAVAVVEHFRRRQALVVATTHHEELKAWASAAPGAGNAAMEVDERTQQPTFRLRSGIAGRSGGIDVAARLGLPGDIVEAARAGLSAERREARERAARLDQITREQEERLATLERERRELEARRISHEEESRRELEELRSRWREAIDAALASIQKAQEALLARITDRTAALQIRAEARAASRTLREQLERQLAPPAGAPPERAAPSGAPAGLRPGSKARLAGFKDPALVESVDAKGRAHVLIRGKRMSVAPEDLTLIQEPGEAAPARGRALPAGVRLQRARQPEVPGEINLIGATVDEALERLDRFLDDAWLAGHPQVRVVHGHGTGKLRAAVSAFLDSHPHVAARAFAEERSGGAGATLVTLRD